MDERQQQIQVGAGLQESRLNTELIGFLEKWGTWILTVVLVLVAGYVGLNKWREYNAARLDDAFEQYAAARGKPGADGILDGSPDGLLKVAAEHSSRGAVGTLARLDAAEIFLGSARRGLKPGTDLAAPKPEDALTPEGTADLLKRSGELFTQVRSSIGGRADDAVLALRAHWGLAAVATSSGDLESAKKTYGDIEALAAKSGFTEQADLAKKRAAQLDLLAVPPTLLSDKDLPVIAAALPPTGPTGSDIPIKIDNPDGLQIQRMPEGFTPPGYDPATNTQAPTPARVEGTAEPAATPATPTPAPAPAPEQPKKP